MANIHDVAARAGVSPATVSRVLNGNHPVSPATRKLVEQAIRELNFEPNLMGRSLSRREQQSILVVISTTAGELYRKTLQGAGRIAAQEKYELMTTCIADDPDDPFTNNWENCARYIRSGMAGGVILFGSRVIQAAAQAPALSVPTVQCSETTLDRFPNSVSCDNRAAMRELTQRLIAQGYRRFAFIASRKPYETEPSDFSRDRLQGIQDALRAAGVPYDPALTLCCLNRAELGGVYSYAEAVKTAQIYAAMPAAERPDIILCSYDTIAFACMDVLQRAGLRVPQDVAVAGFDNSATVALTTPQITSIETPSFEMGSEAARLLISLMRGERAPGCRILLPHKIFERGSTNPALP